MKLAQKSYTIRWIALVALSIAFIGVANQLQAQQSQIYTQFMYNKLNFNAGYAGSLGAPTATLLYRSQWIGLEGAPEAQLVSFDAPLKNEKLALGLNLERQVIGIQEQITVNGAYAYRFKVSPKGKLGLGINVSGRYQERDYTDDRLVATQGLEQDNSIPAGVENQWFANVGFGAYYTDENAYFGFSVPRIIKSDVDFSGMASSESKEVRHYNLMGGYSFDISRTWSLTPQAMVRYTEDAPLDFDINAMFGYRDVFFTGASYRHYEGEQVILAESIDLLVGCKIIPQLYFGLAYDFTLSELGRYSDGSIEIVLRYGFFQPEQKVKYVNPRFF